MRIIKLNIIHENLEKGMDHFNTAFKDTCCKNTSILATLLPFVSYGYIISNYAMFININKHTSGKVQSHILKQDIKCECVYLHEIWLWE
jgi:hypothetical protein